MKKILFITILLSALLFVPSTTFAQDNHTAREEAEGKEVWEKLQAKELACENLSDEDFGALGEYYMGQMTGDSHEAMNTMMERMMGKDGEEQMHVIMGKKLSGCQPNAQVPQSGVGFMPMMWMIGGGGNPMMGGWNSFGILGWLPMLVFWILLIGGVIALIRYLGSSQGNGREEKSPLDILKERYARGEIDKKEFEQIKKEII